MVTFARLEDMMALPSLSHDPPCRLLVTLPLHCNISVSVLFDNVVAAILCPKWRRHPSSSSLVSIDLDTVDAVGLIRRMSDGRV